MKANSTRLHRRTDETGPTRKGDQFMARIGKFARLPRAVRAQVNSRHPGRRRGRPNRPPCPSSPPSSHPIHAAQSSPIKPNQAIFPCFDLTTDPKTAKFRNWQPPRSVRSDLSVRSDNPQFPHHPLWCSYRDTTSVPLNSTYFHLVPLNSTSPGWTK